MSLIQTAMMSKQTRDSNLDHAGEATLHQLIPATKSYNCIKAVRGSDLRSTLELFDNGASGMKINNYHVPFNC